MNSFYGKLNLVVLLCFIVHSSYYFCRDCCICIICCCCWACCSLAACSTSPIFCCDSKYLDTQRSAYYVYVWCERKMHVSHILWMRNFKGSFHPSSLTTHVPFSQENGKYVPAQLISPRERSGSLCLREEHLVQQDAVNLLNRSVYISISVWAGVVV